MAKKTSNWENSEKIWGLIPLKIFLNPMHLVIKIKKSVGRSVEKHGLSKGYYIFWAGFVVDRIIGLYSAK